MSLVYLKAKNVRIYQDLEIQPSQRFNIISGDNASGKTSLLEAIHILSTGRSFRTSKIENVIQKNQSELGVYGRVLRSNGQEIPLGIERSGQNWKIRINGEEKRSLSALAENLPVQYIAPDTHFGFQKNRSQRLRVLDWGVFHVEPGFRRLWREYRHALDQRNRLLKGERIDPKVIKAWDEQIITLGEAITKSRRGYLDQLQPYLHDQDVVFGYHLNLETGFYPGWEAEMPLETSLWSSLERDKATGSTQVGPHRADLVLSCQGADFDELSQGQQKLALTRLYFAQVRMLEKTTNIGSIMLLDDLPSELDEANRHRLLETSATLASQFFITAITGNEIELPAGMDCRQFHVKHGHIQARYSE